MPRLKVLRIRDVLVTAKYIAYNKPLGSNALYSAHMFSIN